MTSMIRSRIQSKPAMSKEKISRIARYTIRGLPLAGILVTSFLPLTILGRQLLMLVLLVWFQIYIIFDVFLYGK
jgi:hypothetical protein